MKRYLFIFLIAFYMTGCNKTRLTGNEYVQWVQDERNGMKKEKELGKFIFFMQYQPAEYNALLELKKNPSMKFDSLVSKRKGLKYFSFRMQPKDRGLSVMKTGLRNENEYMGRLEYSEFEMQNDFLLVKGDDTMPCVLYNAEQNYNAAPFADFVLAFGGKGHTPNKISDEAQGMTFIYNDKIFGVGAVQFHISSGDIQALKKLKIEG